VLNVEGSVTFLGVSAGCGSASAGAAMAIIVKIERERILSGVIFETS